MPVSCRALLFYQNPHHIFIHRGADSLFRMKFYAYKIFPAFFLNMGKIIVGFRILYRQAE